MKRFDRLKPQERFTALIPSTTTLRGETKELTFLGMVATQRGGYLYVATDDGGQYYAHFGGMWVPTNGEVVRTHFDQPKPVPASEPEPIAAVEEEPEPTEADDVIDVIKRLRGR